MSEIRIGISGWRYASWRGDFYPVGLAQKHELEFASRALDSIEINASFYALQTPQRYAAWYAQTPADFVFSVKAPRFITHIRRLREVEQALANFFASGPLQLREKLGPILWQLPPTLGFEAPQFERFLELLPQDSQQARRCARHSAARLHKSGYLDAPQPQRRLRHAVEIRHPSFLSELFVTLLRRYRIALVVADTAGKWPYVEDLTSDFVYLRLHGDRELYSSGYSPAALERWARRIAVWSKGEQPHDARLIDPGYQAPRTARDLYCYFDNDLKARAPHDARALLERLGLADRAPTIPTELQGAQSP